MDIAGKVFIVTGGASGLGAATARMIAGGGGNVVIADVKEAEGGALAKELGAAARFVRTDVTDETSAKAAIAASRESRAPAARRRESSSRRTAATAEAIAAVPSRPPT